MSKEIPGFVNRPEQIDLVVQNGFINNVEDFKVKIVEHFYSLQGEGARAGTPNIFIRFSYCNQACWFCDTDWSKGTEMTIKQLHEEIKQYNCKNIIFTGGEPSLQLNDTIVDYFKRNGYYIAIETNGTQFVPNGIDYISTAPKGTVKRLNIVFKHKINGEIRYPLEKGKYPPNISELPIADHYYVSPLFLGEEKKRFDISDENLQWCIEFVKNNPEWKLSIQQHKLWDIR